MKLSIGFSPCPNDTFIFDALVNGKIDTKGYEFEPLLEDVETLNEWALQGRLDITKLSFAAFFQVIEHYILLPVGSALGKGVGPLLITKDHELTLEQVIEKVDHRNLNVDVEFMKGKMCSTENLAIAIWQELQAVLPPDVKLHCVKLYETPRIYVEYFGE